jgi:RHS repeat-associated protein
VTLPDGVQITSELAPEPRFAMSAPMPKMFRAAAPTLGTLTDLRSRTMTLSNPSDPFTVTNMTETRSVNGRTRTSSWNVTGRTITTTTASSSVNTLTLDAKSRAVAFTAGSLVTVPVTWTYDALGRTTSEGQGAMATSFAYDARNRVTTKTDALGRSYALEYDAADQVTAIVRPSGARVELGYDNDGLMTSLKMPNGAVHALAYGADSMVTSHTPPGGAALTFEYDELGRLALIKLGDGRTISRTYVDGRVTQEAFSEGTTTRTYVGSTDRIATMTRTPSAGPAQTASYTYAGPFVTGITFSGVAVGAYTFTYDLPSAGVSNFWLKTRSLDGGPATTFNYDADGNVIGVGPLSIGRAAPVRAMSSVSIGGVTHWSFAFDSYGRMTSRSMNAAGTKWSSALSFDAGGRIAARTVSVNGGANVAYEYGYDTDGQLVSVKKDGTSVESYTYDSNGNRTSRTAGTTPVETSTFDAQDRLLTRGGLSYEFDAAGFLTKRGSDTFTYSARGELLNATAGGQAISYAYDASGRRVARTDPGGTTQYLYAGPKFEVTHSRAPDGTITEYFYDDLGRLIGLVRAGVTYLVATDEVGTPRIIVDTSGAVMMSAEYDAWGRLLTGNPSAFDIAIGFAGGLRDSITGLVRFGYRDYEPESGRWTARDPIGFDGGQSNLYAYAGSDPIAFIDRDGLQVNGVAKGSGSLKRDLEIHRREQEATSGSNGPTPPSSGPSNPGSSSEPPPLLPPFEYCLTQHSEETCRNWFNKPKPPAPKKKNGWFGALPCPVSVPS